jgi:hypothetical protein
VLAVAVGGVIGVAVHWTGVRAGPLRHALVIADSAYGVIGEVLHGTGVCVGPTEAWLGGCVPLISLQLDGRS